QTVDEKFQNLKRLHTDFEDLKKKELEFEKLEKQREGVQKKEKQVKDYERFYKTFHSLLAEQKKHNTALDKKQSQHKKAKEELNDLRKGLNEKESEQEKIKAYFEMLTQKRAEEDDLGFIAHSLGLREQISGLKKRKRNGRQ